MPQLDRRITLYLTTELSGFYDADTGEFVDTTQYVARDVWATVIDAGSRDASTVTTAGTVTRVVLRKDFIVRWTADLAALFPTHVIVGHDDGHNYGVEEVRQDDAGQRRRFITLSAVASGVLDTLGDGS